MNEQVAKRIKERMTERTKDRTNERTSITQTIEPTTINILQQQVTNNGAVNGRI